VRTEGIGDAEVIDAVGDGWGLDAYEERTGTVADGDALDTFRMWWDLIGVATYVGRFREPHVDDEDTRVAWNGLTEYLDPARWART
jgi:hypothetical protein